MPDLDLGSQGQYVESDSSARVTIRGRPQAFKHYDLYYLRYVGFGSQRHDVVSYCSNYALLVALRSGSSDPASLSDAGTSRVEDSDSAYGTRESPHGVRWKIARPRLMPLDCAPHWIDCFHSNAEGDNISQSSGADVVILRTGVQYGVPRKQMILI